MARRPTTTASCCFVVVARIAPLPSRRRATTSSPRGAFCSDARSWSKVGSAASSSHSSSKMKHGMPDEAEAPPNTSTQPLRRALAGTLSWTSTFLSPAA